MAGTVPCGFASTEDSRRVGLSASSIANALHSVPYVVSSLAEDAIQKDVAPGFIAATAYAAAGAPAIGIADDLERSAVARSIGDSKRMSNASRGSAERLVDSEAKETGAVDASLSLEDKSTKHSVHQDSTPRLKGASYVELLPYDLGSPSLMREGRTQSPHHELHPSGYTPRPAKSKAQSTFQALKAFWKWFLTPFGFLVTLYGLNVVAWGGMLFLLMCNASPAMCWSPTGRGGIYFNCDDINSPRRKWIEWDSQILNALFCVTGFGLAPWRFRDMYYLLRYRFTRERKSGLQAKMFGLRKLAGFYRSWFRLPGSQTLDQMSSKEYRHSLGVPVATWNDVRLPLPESKKPDEPPTGVRAPPTPLWKIDAFVWCQVWNTFFQCCLCGFMWGYNRYNRPGWATGLFVALACGIAGVGGIISFVEGKRVKRVEGVAQKAVVQEAIGHADDDTELGLQQSKLRSGNNRSYHQVKDEPQLK